MILRECARHEPLARILLLSPKFYQYFDYVEVGSFDVASDAFATFRVSNTVYFFFTNI
jgi:calcium binding protein 39